MAVLKYLSGAREHISALCVIFQFFTRPDVCAKVSELLSIFRGSILPSSRATRGFDFWSQPLISIGNTSTIDLIGDEVVTWYLPSHIV